ncbi:hypothetical protein T12_14461 [Trichinella patagoniensis]|uniref:Uncharacterized protein n=1 Tax=Trichinella patagoniensis TaxID=990121 RepID=A0A0V1AG03_9BILA|nr:hypothetical protein T12_14461 [Trichinella patagoniensis]
MIGPPDGADCRRGASLDCTGGTSRELGTRIEWRSWLGPEEKSSRAWAISSFIHLLFRCQGQPFKNGQRQLNLIGIADWQLPTGNTCIVNYAEALAG